MCDFFKSVLVGLGLNKTVHIPLTTALPFSDGYFGRKKLKAQDLLADELAPIAALFVTACSLKMYRCCNEATNTTALQTIVIPLFLLLIAIGIRS